MIERDFIDMPSRVAGLPRDDRGYPIPRFVEWIDGAPDFRVMSYAHLTRCIRHEACWICGERLGTNKVFVIGPMCVCNRVSAEPPSHYECALFAAKNCPFLTRPLARRRDTSDVGATATAGLMIERNPGVCALWTTKRYRPFRDRGGVLFDIGEPERVEFYAKGRRATREELDESIRTGLPILENAAQMDGPDGVRALGHQVKRMNALIERFAP